MKIDYNILFKSMIVLVIAAVVLILAQMWLHLFNMLVFWKLLATVGILGGLVCFLIAVKQDLSDEKNLRDNKFLD
jgi:hypothetical protein